MPASGRDRKWPTLVAMCFGLFMVMLDATIVSNALPTIQRDLNMSTTELQWVNNAYTVMIGSVVIAAGRIGDLFGRRRFFIIGVVLFATGSALSGAAQSSDWIIFARGFQGIGSGIMVPLTLSIIDQAFPPEERGRAIGIWAGISGLALSIGPLLGGVITQDASWRWIFYVNLPIAAIALLMTLRVVEESRDESASRQLDYPGLLTSTAGLIAVVLGVMEGQSWGWGSTATLSCLVSGVALLTAFVMIERITAKRGRTPLVDLDLFKNLIFTGSNVVAFLVSFGMLGSLFFLPLYLQNVLHYDPITSGVAILPMTILITAAAPVSGRAADRLGARLPMVVGQLAMFGAFLLFVQVTPTSGYSTLWAPLVMMGLGIGTVMSPMSTAAMNSAPETKAGAASGVLNMNRQVGGTFGVAILGVVFTNFANGKLNSLLAPYPASLQARAKTEYKTVTANPSVLHHELVKLPSVVVAKLEFALKEIFVSGFTNAFMAAAIVAAVGAAITVVMIRARRPAPGPLEPAPSGALATGQRGAGAGVPQRA